MFPNSSRPNARQKPGGCPSETRTTLTPTIFRPQVWPVLPSALMYMRITPKMPRTIRATPPATDEPDGTPGGQIISSEPGTEAQFLAIGTTMTKTPATTGTAITKPYNTKSKRYAPSRAPNPARPEMSLDHDSCPLCCGITGGGGGGGMSLITETVMPSFMTTVRNQVERSPLV